MSYLKSAGTTVIYIGLFLAVITFMPGLPPETEFQEYSIVPPRDLDPKVGPKNRLNGAEKLFDGEINAPEGLASYNGQLYTGLHGGYIVRIDEDRFVPIVKFGEKCEGIWQEHKCGRPLGLKFDKEGNLYVVDTYYGIFKVNVATGEYQIVVNISEPIDGKISRIPNSVDIAENGDLYWTVSSTEFALYDITQSFLANPSGRLIRYNAAKKKNEVLMRDLGFANGVILSDDESFVLVTETGKNRIMKYNLKGPKAGQQEIFIDGLSGLPDNLHSDGQGGFLVTTIVTVDSEHPQISQSLAPHPYLRKMIIRLLWSMELPFKLLHDFYPNTYAERILHAIGSYQGLAAIVHQLEKSLVLRIDASGNIMEVLYADDGIISGISAAYIHNGFLWFGSPWRSYLARVPLKQAFPDLANNEKQFSHTRSGRQAPNDAASKRTETVKPVESKPSQTTPKSTAAPTTTPKPTAAPTTPKPTAAPTTTPKPIPAPKADKSTATDSENAKTSETKSTSKSANAEVKKDSVKRVNDPKPDTKSNSPNAKSETNNRKEDTKTSTKSRKSVKVEEDASVKQKAQKSQPEKVKPVEINRPRDDL